MNFKLRVALLSLLLGLVGCAGDPPQPQPLPPTIVKLQIESAPDSNPGSNGEAAPVMVRIYELKENAGFLSVDFFALFNNDKSVLADELARKSEVFVRPGEVKSLDLQPEDGVKFLGAFAGFRQLDNAQWRGCLKLDTHQLQTVTLKMQRNQLQLQTSVAAN